jgi:hypothetical protein
LQSTEVIGRVADIFCDFFTAGEEVMQLAT